MPTTMELIQRKAAQDAEFRAALLRDPHAALAGEGIELPDEVRVTVVEATPEHVTLVLPPRVDEDGELGEDALAGSAGGTFVPPSLACFYPPF
jgi:hypothetical protein